MEDIDKIRAGRARFYAALEDGMSPEDAAALVNGDAETDGAGPSDWDAEAVSKAPKKQLLATFDVPEGDGAKVADIRQWIIDNHFHEEDET